MSHIFTIHIDFLFVEVIVFFCLIYISFLCPIFITFYILPVSILCLKFFYTIFCSEVLT